MTNNSNEFKLLIEASQITPSSSRILTLFDEGIRQKHLLKLALANGVLPLVYQELCKYPKILMDDDIKKYTIEIKNTNFFMSAQLLQLVFLLKEKGISILPIKGPALAQHAYKDIALRPFSDLDILAKRDDLQEISSTLLDMGYQNEKSLSALIHPFILKKSSDISFIHPDTGVVIELHWKLLKSVHEGLSNIPALFKQSITLPFQNTELSSLPLEEEFLYLCIHAAKHRFERIEWMNDINRLYELYCTTYDWNKLLDMAMEEGYLSAYLLGLLILNKQYQRNILDKSTQRLMQGKKVSYLYMKVLSLHADDYILKPKKDGFRWMEFFFSLKLEDSLTKKASLLASLIFPLYMDDVLSIKEQPSYLSFIYYLVRLKRLFGL